MPFDASRHDDDPGIPARPPLRFDRLAAGAAIDISEPRRVRRARDMIGNAAGAIIIAIATIAALALLT